ncbi:MAG: hypothetical protein DKINENOH_03771 [bacterium]|nr:hypothetical protein [bacterium]
MLLGEYPPAARAGSEMGTLLPRVLPVSCGE